MTARQRLRFCSVTPFVPFPRGKSALPYLFYKAYQIHRGCARDAASNFGGGRFGRVPDRFF